MQKITEEMGLQKDWYKEAAAKDMVMEKLPAFLKKLTEDFEHDYGTICHALTAGALATMWAMNRTPQGGITGFQSGCIMWEFIQEWQSKRGQPMRLISYEEMLYPQYAEKFQKTISLNTWKYLQDEARKNLQEERGNPAVHSHWESIVAGTVPFGYSISED